MPLYIQKFGGTSLADPDCIARVADKIIATKSLGIDVVVVVSAMAGQTNHLIGLAQALSAHPDPREYDVLVSAGEQVSIALLAMALIERGCQSQSFTGVQADIHTQGPHKKAVITGLNSNVLLDTVKSGIIPVVAGFQGVNIHGDVATLGRGGSDMTAVALASELSADECQIYSDVAGLYTADPHWVPQAKLIRQIDFSTMQIYADLGAKVMQYHAVALACERQVPIRIMSAFSNNIFSGLKASSQASSGEGKEVSFAHGHLVNNVEAGSQVFGDGTLISDSKASLPIAGVAFSPIQAVFEMKLPVDEISSKLESTGMDGKDIAASINAVICGKLNEHGLRVDYFTGQGPDILYFCVDQVDGGELERVLSGALNISFKRLPGLVKLSLVGQRFGCGESLKKAVGVLSDILPLDSQYALSESRVSFLVDQSILRAAVSALHQGFILDCVKELSMG